MDEIRGNSVGQLAAVIDNSGARSLGFLAMDKDLRCPNLLRSVARELKGGYVSLRQHQVKETENAVPATLDNFREQLAAGLKSYPLVIVDLPAASDPSALRSAAACHAVYLICGRGTTDRAQLSEMRHLFELARVPLRGLVLREHGFVSPGKEIARRVEKSVWGNTSFGRWLRKTAATSSLLD